MQKSSALFLHSLPDLLQEMLAAIMRRMYSIEVKDLVKRFRNQNRDVIHRMTFAVPARQCVSLLGPSGCGKTTLLRLLMGIEQPTAGTLTIDAALAGHLSYVFQEPRLVPWRTSLENVVLPLELSRNDPLQNETAFGHGGSANSEI